MYLKLLKQMFQEMVVRKDISKISQFYHSEFLLFTNEQTMDYKAFVECHEKIYETQIEYQVQYDEETFLQEESKVAGRIWITTQMPKKQPKKIEVILIVQYKEKKIYRLWELTYPDWSQLPEFDH